MEYEENLDELSNLITTIPNFYNSIITCNSYQAQDIVETKNPNDLNKVSHSQLLSFGRSSNTPVHVGNPSHEVAANDLNQSSQIISFSSPNNVIRHNYIDHTDQYEISPKRVLHSSSMESPLKAEERVLAERRRRERQSQLFISLSKIVPGLRKMDKATLLEDSIKHLKALQERVKALEELEELNKRYNDALKINDNCCMSEDDKYIAKNESLSPEIKAKVSNNYVLINIFCNKKEGLISIIPFEMEKMQLCVLDMRFMPFGGSALCGIILAEMKNEFHGTVKDIVDRLQMVLFS